MTMTPAVRKFVLTTHVTLSVGWLGAVATFLVLSIAGLLSHDKIMRCIELFGRKVMPMVKEMVG